MSRVQRCRCSRRGETSVHDDARSREAELDHENVLPARLVQRRRAHAVRISLAPERIGWIATSGRDAKVRQRGRITYYQRAWRSRSTCKSRGRLIILPENSLALSCLVNHASDGQQTA